ncbi:predicted protein [Naegleria gruberi]|uniref:Predicted protein n=1 Tax=Naegleria gruberi TaxID=5762 RepID=D2VTP4_NAEGR|nr:uncharacterized protein NAEGRDRAFT_72374 [Naegleria gruberi]EFC39689.1 predicted protein [Naegleria gruberi]|eukprot:XP_002672433.1 predicted protein [Naegleria gruberi strain NEG-M]
MGFDEPSTGHRQCIFPMINSQNTLVNFLFERVEGTDRMVSYSIAIVERFRNEEIKKNITIVIGKGYMWFHTVRHLLKTFGGDEIKVFCLEETKVKYQGNYDVLIGTPEKIKDLLESGIVNCKDISLLVVDQLDEWNEFNLNMHEILRNVNCQIFWCSNGKRNDFTNEIYLKSPIVIESKDVEKNNMVLNCSSRHFNIGVEKEIYKLEVLEALLETIPINTVIYCNSDNVANGISNYLQAHNLAVSCLSKDMSELEIEQKTNEFREGNVQLHLILANLKVSRLKFNPRVVINFNLPWQNDKYTYWTPCFSLITNEDRIKLKEIEKIYSIEIQDKELRKYSIWN